MFNDDREMQKADRQIFFLFGVSAGFVLAMLLFSFHFLSDFHSVRPNVSVTPVQTHENIEVEDVSADYEEAIDRIQELGLGV